MEKVAILYICTGKYDIFWKDFFVSYERYFLPHSAKEYFVFTDAEHIYNENSEKVHKIYQKVLGWPYDTLMRFHTFLKAEDELRNFDYIFFMNANCLCVDYVQEDFLPQEKGLLVVQHPGFYNKTPDDYTYDRNKDSTAYIAYGQGTYYVCGGINGGKAEEYLELVHVLKNQVEEDIKNGVMALWHDESHLNKYIAENDNFEIRSPGFWYPEDWDIPFVPHILVRDKSKWIDVEAIKEGKIRSKLKRMKRALSKVVKKILRRKLGEPQNFTKSQNKRKNGNQLY